MDSPNRPTIVALGALAAFGVLFVAGGVTGWWEPADYESAIGEISRWCERVSGGIMREPANTLGNLGFVVVGLAMFRVLARDTRNGVDIHNDFFGNQPIALLYASAAVFLGPGSMVMHGSHTFFGAWIDNVSMVAYISIPWLYNVARFRGWSHRTLFGVYASVVVAYAAAYWFFGPDLGIGLNLFGVSIALWVISEMLFRFWSPAARWWSGLVGFLVAGVFGVTPAVMLESPGDHWWVVLFWLPGMLADRHPGQGASTFRGSGRGSCLSWLGTPSGLLAPMSILRVNRTRCCRRTPSGTCCRRWPRGVSSSS